MLLSEEKGNFDQVNDDGIIILLPTYNYVTGKDSVNLGTPSTGKRERHGQVWDR